MEINAEINKVFGEEMAKLFAAKISEEEMLKTAADVWNDMCAEESNSWNKIIPESTRIIQNALKENLVKQVKVLTATSEFQDECRALAERMVDEIREETHRKVVEEVSSRLAGLSVGGHGLGLRGMIEDIIGESMRR